MVVNKGGILIGVLVASGILLTSGAMAELLNEQQELQRAELIVGPENSEDDCASCHTLEHEAWQTTRHYATFKDRHRSPEAKKILANLGEKSMKRISECRQCHYTSIVKRDKLRAKWGVSCESCHGPARNWLNVHNRPAGNPSADALEWGQGKSEAPSSRSARLTAAADHGMLHPARLYDIAANCYGCHTVPNEHLVNVGKHHSGKAFDLVARSQGEVRHNFVSSDGAPDHPTNRPASAAELRRMYITGALVDLEYSIRNLSRAEEPKGDFYHAMLSRVNAAQEKLANILKAVKLPAVRAAVEQLPRPVVRASQVNQAVADRIQQAAKTFVATFDGSTLGAVDGLLPKKTVGQPYQP